MYGTYFISQMLHEWFAQLVITQGNWPQFDLVHFARAGGCDLKPRSAPHGLWFTAVSDREDGDPESDTQIPRLCQHVWAAWMDVRWNEHDLILTLATTNHPERLDPAILDRPSRFDRKYTFALPAESERLAYLQRWNNRIEVEMRISPEAAQRFAQQTSGFSYAYLKELTLASVLRWISTRQAGGMEAEMQSEMQMLGQQISEARLSKRERKQRASAQEAGLT